VGVDRQQLARARALLPKEPRVQIGAPLRGEQSEFEVQEGPKNRRRTCPVLRIDCSRFPFSSRW
jgi:hypothetical protein